MAEPAPGAPGDDGLDAIFEQRLRGPGPAPTPVAPNTPDPTVLESMWEHRLGVIGDLRNASPDKFQGPSRAAWDAGWNLFDAAMLGYGREAVAGVRGEPAAEATLKQYRGRDAQVKAALDRHHERVVAMDQAKEQWQRENPGLGALTTVAGALPTSLLGIAGGEAALGRTVGALGRYAAPNVTRLVTGEMPGLVARPTGLAIRGSAEGAASALETSKLGEGSTLEQMQTGAATGAVLNPLTRQLVRGLVPNNPTWAKSLASDMKDLGIPVRAAQMPGADVGTRVVGALTGAADNAAQRTALTRRIAQNIGQDTDRLDAAAITKAHQDLDTKFDAVAPRLRVAGNDADLLHALGNIDSDATRELGLVDPTKYKVVDGLLTRVQNEMATASAAGGPGGGFVPGETFRAMTRYGSTLSSAMHSTDPNIRHFAGRISEALHDAMERATPAADVAALRTAKSQWKNMLIAQEVADPVTGTVDPSKLLAHVDRKYGSVDPAVAGEMGTLAQGADRFLIGESRRPGHELGGRTKAALGALGAGGIGTIGALSYEHGGELLHHLLHNPLAVGAGITTAGGAYGGARLAGPVIRRGINPLLPPAVVLKNWPDYRPGEER